MDTIIEPNPIREERLRLSLSITDFSKILEVSTSTLLRTEQGLYVDIPPTILRYFDSHSLTPWSIRPEYVRYQTSQRASVLEQQIRRLDKENKDILDVLPQLDYNTMEHPLVNWYRRLGYKTRLEFCKAFCLHPSSIIRFEAGRTRSVPEQLSNVLWGLELGLVMVRLQDSYREWRTLMKEPLFKTPKEGAA